MTALALAAVCAAAWVTLVSPDGVSQAAEPTGVTTRASVTNAGDQSPDGGGQSQLSGNGRYDVFVSTSDLDAQLSNGTHDDCDCSDPKQVPNYAIYVRDLVAKTTTLLSVGKGDIATTASPNNNSSFPSISADGRYYAFATEATNIAPPVPGAQPGDITSIIVCDRGPAVNGVYPALPKAGAPYPATLHCYTVAQIDKDLAYLEDYQPHLSANGSRIVWADQPDDYGNVHTLALTYSASGALQAPQLGNIRNFGGETDGPYPLDPPLHSEYFYDQPQLSADGNWLVMSGFAESAEADTIVEADLRTQPAVLRRVDVSSTVGGTKYFGDTGRRPGHPAVSGDGRRIAFDVDNDPYATENNPQVYVADIATGTFAVPAVTPAAVALRKSDVGSPTRPVGRPGDGAYPSLSADGRYLAFVTDHKGMWAGAAAAPALYNCLHPAPTGFTSPGEQAGAVATPTPSDTPTDSGSSGPPGERFVICQVVARDLTVDAGRLAAGDPFLPAELASPSTKALCSGATSTDVCPGNADSDHPVSLSANGGLVTYDSGATDLTTGTDTNKSTDSFVREWTPKVTGGPVAFGPVIVGTAVDKPLTITMSGFGPVPVGSFTVSGPGAGDYTVDTTGCAGRTLYSEPPAGAASCTVTVTFTPTTPGSRPATITVTTPSEPGRPGRTIVTVPVSGSGTAITPPPTTPPPTTPPPTTPPPTTPPPTIPPHKGPPAFAAHPTHVDFGSAIPLKVHGTKRTVTLTNPGGQQLVISSITVHDGTVSGASGDYTVDVGCESGGTIRIAAGASCIVTLVWTGQAVGHRDATLVVKAAAPVGTRTIPLVANVPKPKITANPVVLPSGRVTMVSGEGFAPNGTVDVKVPFSATTERTTSATGTFTAALLVLRGATAGPRDVVATMPDLSPTITAKTPLLVVLGSVQGPILVTRH